MPSRHCATSSGICAPSDREPGRLKSGAIPRSFLFWCIGHHPVDIGQEQGREDEGHVDDGQPHDLVVACTGCEFRNICSRWIDEMATMVEATLIFREPASILPSQASSASFAFRLVKAADEVFVTGNDHHHDEAGHQAGIDQRQDLQDGIRLLHDHGPWRRTPRASSGRTRHRAARASVSPR